MTLTTFQKTLFIGSVITGIMLAPMGAYARHHDQTPPAHAQNERSEKKDRGERARQARAIFNRARAPQTSVVDIAVAVNRDTGEFSTLIAALQEVNLDKILDRVRRDVTVFAPTDAAFANLGLNADNIGDALTKKQILYVLSHHLAIGELDSNDVLAATEVQVLNGQFLTPALSGGNAFLIDKNSVSEDAQIVAVDNFADNGVVHIIDEVLLPNGFLE